MISPLILLAAAAALPGAKACGPDVYAALTAPRKPNEVPYRLACSVTLRNGDAIARRIIMSGASASGVVIDCAGGSIGFPGIGDLRLGGMEAAKNPFAISTIVIASQPRGDGWSPPSDIAIRRCTVHGNIRTSGINGARMLSASRLPGFTAYAQENAPRRITISDSTLIVYRHIPLYLGVGTTGLTLRRSRVEGNGEAAVYFDLESGHNRLLDNSFAVRATREMVAIDASAHNLVAGNRFELVNHDGVRLYRNCGESGIIRHQTPSHNRINDNQFAMPAGATLKPVFVNARSAAAARLPFCDLDKGYPFGSSADDRDGGTDNEVSNNRVIRR